jgi:hypothetical protein
MATQMKALRAQLKAPISTDQDQREDELDRQKSQTGAIDDRPTVQAVTAINKTERRRKAFDIFSKFCGVTKLAQGISLLRIPSSWPLPGTEDSAPPTLKDPKTTDQDDPTK